MQMAYTWMQSVFNPINYSLSHIIYDVSKLCTNTKKLLNLVMF